MGGGAKNNTVVGDGNEVHTADNDIIGDKNELGIDTGSNYVIGDGIRFHHYNPHGLLVMTIKYLPMNPLGIGAIVNH